ncbi:MAG: sialidase family protein, partial [Terriglobia bacterium]
MIFRLHHGIQVYKWQATLSVRGAYESFSHKKPYRLGLWIIGCLPFALLTPAVASPAPAEAQPAPPGVVIDHISKQTMEYIGSPSIVILPNGNYVSSHDLFGPDSNQSTSGETEVFRSTDRGLTWAKVAVLHDQFWSNLFVLHGKLYLMGSSHEYGRVVIRQSLNGGSTWTSPSFLTSGSGYHTAPVPIVQKNGRVWRAMEFHPAGPWGHFKAFVLSAPANSNLLDPKNWSMTEQLPYPQNESEGDTWLEGNAVIAPDGSILDILRVDDIEKAAILKVDGLR